MCETPCNLDNNIQIITSKSLHIFIIRSIKLSKDEKSEERKIIKFIRNSGCVANEPL